ncbi:SURF1 family protein [Brevibacterium moorei]|uniref:SURF1 family protein n=1 Tax=Brevibacterium moorei TaxID=2968457 RepID=UPI00211CFBAC|nr:SURF1 family protein [Brevibacterium sp. 68QC2CO]MCQ9384530.1 SURF1 family protein [Brevibacterium sp. 68QC2CO]
MLRLALTPRWLGFLVLVLALCTVFVGLAGWQAYRAEHKNDAVAAQGIDELKPFNEVIAAQVPTSGLLAHQRVELRGKFLPDDQIVVSDRAGDEGKSGYWVVTMFVPEGARLGAEAKITGEAKLPIAIPVVRGWTADLATARDSRAPDSAVELHARINPIEAPTGTDKSEPGTYGSVSTSELVNLFDVYSYSAMLMVDADQQAKVAGGELGHVSIGAKDTGGFDLQSGVYTLEWLFFAGFALYMWYSLLRDAYQNKQGIGLPDMSEARAAGVEYVIVKGAGEHELRTTATPVPVPTPEHTLKPTDAQTKDEPRGR